MNIQGIGLHGCHYLLCISPVLMKTRTQAAVSILFPMHLFPQRN